MALRKASSILSLPSVSSSCVFFRTLERHGLKHAFIARNFSSLAPEHILHQMQETERLSSADHAFIARTGLQFSTTETYLQAITHKSYKHGEVSYNDRLSYLGQKVLGLYVTEFIHSKYPNIPCEALRDAVNAYTCLPTLGRFGRALGVHSVMRWQEKDPEKTGESTVAAKTTMALIGALYHDKGSIVAKKFIHAGILTKEIDMQAIVQLDQPKRLLSALLKRKNMEPPMSRLISETGRFSATPTFIVGVFSGLKKIGDGFGSSIKMAEHRAAKDALIQYFLKDISNPVLPSDIETLPEESQLSFMGTPLGDTPPII